MTTPKDCCISGHIHAGTPTGSSTTVYGLPAYVALPKDNKKENTAVFLSDIFGYETNNVRLLADEWAKLGWHVVVPDYLENDPCPIELLHQLAPNLREAEKKTLVDKASDAVKSTATFGPWAIKHRDAVTRPIVDKFFEAARADADIKKIAVVGFCFGGRHAVLLGSGHLVDAVISYHPAGLSIPTELNSLVTPTLLCVGDSDVMLSLSQVDEAKAAFDEMKTKNGSRGLDVIVYEKAVHGFAVRGDDEAQYEKDLKVKAIKDAQAFLKEFL